MIEIIIRTYRTRGKNRTRGKKKEKKIIRTYRTRKILITNQNMCLSGTSGGARRLRSSGSSGTSIITKKNNSCAAPVALSSSPLKLVHTNYKALWNKFHTSFKSFETCAYVGLLKPWYLHVHPLKSPLFLVPFKSPLFLVPLLGTEGDPGELCRPTEGLRV